MTEQPTEKRQLSLLDGTMLVMGSMIGSGIFIVSAAAARDVGSTGLMMSIWVLAGIITVLGALNYGELAAMMPKAGGQYVYLREAYGPMFGFLYGWTLFTVIQTGTIAAVGVGFAKFTGVFVPGISADTVIFSIGSFAFNTQQLVGIAVVFLLTLLNFNSVKTGAMVQNLFTVTKILALLGIVVVGLVVGLGQPDTAAVAAAPVAPATPGPSFWDVGLLAFGAAMIGALFSSDAWNNVTFTAGEMRNPQRSVPLSLLIGTSTVILIYIFCNVVYVNVLGLEGIQNAPEDRVGTALMNAVMGPSGMLVMAALIMISTFGCLNGLILSGARVYSAMAKDGLFFPAAARMNKNGVPAWALVAQAVWASALTLTGKYGDLLDYVMFAVLLFYILTVASVIVLRIKKPDMHRPYKVFAYPVLPVLYIILALWICVALLIEKRDYTFPGLGIVLLGVPVFFVARKLLGKKG